MFTGLGFDRLDRWRARDCDLDSRAGGEVDGRCCSRVPRRAAIPPHGWPYLALDGAIVALVVLVVAINVWRCYRRRRRCGAEPTLQRLAAFGFTLGGVPYEWLPGRPPPAGPGWQSPPVAG